MDRAAELARSIKTLAGAGDRMASAPDAAAAAELLASCKVCMRDRSTSDALLTVETLDRFLVLAEAEAPTSRHWEVNEEALKCAINSVYARPEFVELHPMAQRRLIRVLGLAKRAGPASFHLLVWKLLLVSCEAPSVSAALSASQEAWELLFSTLYFGVHDDCAARLADDGDRTALVLDLLKLLAVLVSSLQWTTETENAQPETFAIVHRVGELLLGIVHASHPSVSPLHSAMIDVKNRALEVFMFVPPPLLAAFVSAQQQQLPSGAACASDCNTSVLSGLVNHLRTMLLATRVEKTRPFSEILPTLIVCHSLTQTAGSEVTAYLQHAVLPVAATAHSSASPVTDDQATAFYFKHLTFFLTCLDTNVKRCAGEWLFLLCDENADEFTRRTGLGNAIGMLRIKGFA